jgi:hypothetical protein
MLQTTKDWSDQQEKINGIKGEKNVNMADLLQHFN